MKGLIVIAFSLFISLLAANTYTDINATLASLTNGTVAWADYDRDGDLDLLVTGRNDEINPILRSRLFRNDNGSFNNTAMVIPGVDQSATSWCDLDNDNDLDLVVTGNTSSSGNPLPVICLYLNNNGSLILTDMGMLPVSKGSLAWIDVDKDGYKDLVVTGNASTTGQPQPSTVLYHNDHGILSASETQLMDVYESALMVFDYNSDGFDDLLISGNEGNDSSPVPTTVLYKNVSGLLEFTACNLPAVRLPSLDWSDYDRDGDPDIMLAGYMDGPGMSITSIYENNLGSFSAVAGDFYPVSPSSITWGDYDIDGQIDLMFTGNTILGGFLEPITALYRNTEGSFLYIYDAPVTVINGMAAFGDYDADNDPDIALTGEHPLCPGGPITRIYRNDIETTNAPPSVPENLTANFNNGIAFFSWNASTDNVTHQNSITYNLRIGTTPGGCEILSPMADISTGRNYLPQRGNTRYNHTRKIPGLSAGTYYWSVQAIDDSYTASAFAPEQMLNTTSTEDVTASPSSIRAYPNPLSNSVTFTFTNSRNAVHSIKIFNIKGQEVKSFTLTAEQTKSGSVICNLNDLSSGVYVYTFTNGKQQQKGKITILP